MGNADTKTITERPTGMSGNELVYKMMEYQTKKGLDPIQFVQNFVQQNPTRINEMIEYVKRTSGTLLHWACFYGCKSTVEYLLYQNAALDIKFESSYEFGFYEDYHGKTALEIAKINTYNEIEVLFKTIANMSKGDQESLHKSRELSRATEDSQNTKAKQYFSAAAVEHIKQHLSNILQKKTQKTRFASLVLLEEKFEEENLEKDVNLFKKLESIFDDKLKDPFDYNTYSSTWNSYFPKFFSVKASSIVRNHLEDIVTRKSDKTRLASFDILEEQFEELKDDLKLLHEIKSKLNFNQFDINTYLAVFNVYLQQASSGQDKISTTTTPNQKRATRCEPPTARLSPGQRFLKQIPTAPTDQKSVIDGLKTYATENHLPLATIKELEDKIEDFTDPKIRDEEKAFAMALCWLYTTESWVYVEVNTKLRDDSSNMASLIPYMKALIESYKSFKGDEENFYSGVVFRRTKLTRNGLEFYKPDLNFVWSSFTSTSIEFNPDADFGKILFEITIPLHFKKYALCLENLSAFPMEREVLLLPNIAYRVVAIERGPTDEYPNTTCIIKVTMEYVCIVI